MKHYFYKFLETYTENMKKDLLTPEDNNEFLLAYYDFINDRKIKYKNHNEKYRATREKWYRENVQINKSIKNAGFWDKAIEDRKAVVIKKLLDGNKTKISKYTGLSRTSIYSIINNSHEMTMTSLEKLERFFNNEK